jgi:hypothetical protein
VPVAERSQRPGLILFSCSIDANRAVGQDGKPLSGRRERQDAAVYSMTGDRGGVDLFAVGCTVDRNRHGLQVRDVRAGVPIHIAVCAFHSNRKDVAAG